MRLTITIPLTGTVLVEKPVNSKSFPTGDPNDPVRPIDIDLGNVSWHMVDINFNNEVMIIEVSPGETISEDTGEVDAASNPIYRTRQATEQEKSQFLQHAQGLVMNHTKDELHEMSKCPRLKRPFKKLEKK